MLMQNSAVNTVLREAPESAVAALIKEGMEPLAARVLAARNIDCRTAVSPPLKSLPSPAQLPGLAATAAALAQVCKCGEPLCIIGDYDVDGVTATILAYDCLRRLGANVSWYIPNRSKNGYGLSEDIVKQQAAAGVLHLLTVDNGVSAHAGIACAQALGMRVYVTDHHQPDSCENQADYLVNPQVDNGGYAAFNNLVGVGVAFYLMAQLRRELNADIDMTAYLDLVALGTIADCGVMDDTNRALSAAGLARIRAGKTRPGIEALIGSGRLVEIKSRAVSYRLAPRLNAAGRMDSVDVAMHCLLAEKMKHAEEQVLQLNTLNDERLKRQNEMMDAVLCKIDDSQNGIVVSDDSWYAGIVGIIASKVAERFRRPTFVFYLESEEQWRGSGRAIAGIDLIGILNDIAKAHPQVLLSYGGHRQAASVVVKNDFMPVFAELFDNACSEKINKLPPPAELVDSLCASDVTHAALTQLENVVWGNGFPPPRYAGRFVLMRSWSLRGGYLRLQVAETASDIVFNALYFGGGELPTGQFAAIYSADINPYNGRVELVMEKIIPSEAG